MSELDEMLKHCLVLFVIVITLTFCSGKVTTTAHTPHSNFQSFPFRFSYRPVDLVKGLTQNVTLKCAMIPNAAHPFLLVNSIIIAKERHGGWQDLVEVTQVTGLKVFDKSITADGAVNDVSTAYLEIHWPLAVEEIFDIYSCVVHGFDDNFKELEEISEVLVKEYDCD